MWHDVFEPGGGKASMSQLSCKGFCFEDGKAASVGAPSRGEFLPEWVEEVRWSVDGQATCVDDVTQDPVDRRNGHFFEFVEGNGVLPEVQCRWAEEDEDGFNAGRCSTLDAGYIEEFDVDVVIDID